MDFKVLSEGRMGDVYKDLRDYSFARRAVVKRASPFHPASLKLSQAAGLEWAQNVSAVGVPLNS